MSIHKGGEQIRSLEDWRRIGGPKRPHQWAEGRSALEVARAWLPGGGTKLPPEVEVLMRSHKDFGHLRVLEVEPEAKLPFDTFKGEPRNSDLVVLAQDHLGPVFIAVEAKADEPFGETVEEALGAALERLMERPNSKGIQRIEQLADALLPYRHPGGPKVGKLRYQLLTAAAGALVGARRRGFQRAVLLIHEFVTDKTEDRHHWRNSYDLDEFVQRVSEGSVSTVEPGVLVGPFFVPGEPLLDESPALYIGKAVRELRARAG